MKTNCVSAEIHLFTFGTLSLFHYLWCIKITHKKDNIAHSFWEAEFFPGRIIQELFLNLVGHYNFITHFWCIFYPQSVIKSCFLFPNIFSAVLGWVFLAYFSCFGSSSKIRKNVNEKILSLNVIVQFCLLIYLGGSLVGGFLLFMALVWYRVFLFHFWVWFFFGLGFFCYILKMLPYWIIPRVHVACCPISKVVDYWQSRNVQHYHLSLEYSSSFQGFEA